MRKTPGIRFSVSSAIFLATVLSSSAPGAEPSQLAPPASAQPPAQQETLKAGVSDRDDEGTLPEKIDVQAMKRRYWTVGNEDMMDVVQNRLYKKKGRLELAARYGFYSDDPFEDMKTMGFSMGYHINEYFSMHGFYASVSSSGSSAYEQAQQQGFLPLVNPTKSVMGLEARGSLIYGKLSLLGKSIIYYDFNIAGGLAKFSTHTNSPIGWFLGVGQQVYLNKTWFVTVDYRYLSHSEDYGTVTTGSRSLSTNWIQVGIGAFVF